MELKMDKKGIQYESGMGAVLTAHRTWDSQEDEDVFEAEYSFGPADGPAKELECIVLTAEEAEELNRSGRFTRVLRFLAGH